MDCLDLPIYPIHSPTDFSPYSFSTFGLENHKKKSIFCTRAFSPFPSHTDYSDAKESITFSKATTNPQQLNDADWRL